MDVTAIAAGHAITSVPVKVVALCFKTDRRIVPKIPGQDALPFLRLNGNVQD